jgi:hypothetical protein
MAAAGRAVVGRRSTPVEAFTIAAKKTRGKLGQERA